MLDILVEAERLWRLGVTKVANRWMSTRFRDAYYEINAVANVYT